jgi:hypothetical protein
LYRKIEQLEEISGAKWSELSRIVAG